MPAALMIALTIAELAAKALPAGLQLLGAIGSARDAINTAQAENRDLRPDEVRALMEQLLAAGDELEQLGRAADQEQ